MKKFKIQLKLFLIQLYLKDFVCKLEILFNKLFYLVQVLKLLKFQI